MVRFPVRKAIHFTVEQAAELERLADLPDYQYNDEPSVAAVVRDAVSLFLSQLSTTVDNSDRLIVCTTVHTADTEPLPAPADAQSAA